IRWSSTSSMPTSARPPRAAATKRRKPRLALSVQRAIAADGLPASSALRRWIERALEPRVSAAAITLRFVGEAEGRRLNLAFRRRDYATNALTFVYDDARNAATLTGDIVLCVPVLKREAREQQKTLRAHCAHL